jgi:hypothetical protein
LRFRFEGITGFGPELLGPVAQLVGAVAAVADQSLEGQALEQGPGLAVVGRLAGRQQEAQGPTEPVDDRVDLGGQATARTAERLLAEGRAKPVNDSLRAMLVKGSGRLEGA